MKTTNTYQAIFNSIGTVKGCTLKLREIHKELEQSGLRSASGRYSLAFDACEKQKDKLRAFKEATRTAAEESYTSVNGFDIEDVDWNDNFIR
jgi:hypothetical protein